MRICSVLFWICSLFGSFRKYIKVSSLSYSPSNIIAYSPSHSICSRCSSLSPSSFHPNRGSYLKASTMTRIDYLLILRIFNIFSQVCLKIPSVLHAPIALTIILVNLKGTFSGKTVLILFTSKQSPKSICTTFQVSLWIIILKGCRSPSPMMYPTIDITARLLMKHVLFFNHFYDV